MADNDNDNEDDDTMNHTCEVIGCGAVILMALLLLAIAALATHLPPWISVAG